jgi:hypothetical protein
MALEISEESRRATTKCVKGMSCLAAVAADLCAVESCVDRKIYFVRCLHENKCAFKQSFGNWHYCTCPVRKEIFDRYNI